MKIHPRINDYAQDLGLGVRVNGSHYVIRDLGQNRCLMLTSVEGTGCPQGLSEPARVNLWFDGMKRQGIVLAFDTARQAMRFMAHARIDFSDAMERK